MLDPWAVAARVWESVRVGVARVWQRLRRRARQQKRQIEAEAEQLRQEVVQEVKSLGAELWDWVDDLPFVAALAPIPPIANQFYGHGAFMGAAPALLDDPRWRRILAFLMPDVFEDVRRAVREGVGAGGIIPMFENNPVMCAFGIWRGVEQRRKHRLAPAPLSWSGIEWDVFVESAAVEAWEQEVDPAEKDRRLEALVSRLIIAHASTADTVQEQLGLCQYEDVRRTAKTGMGGVELAAWLDLFARALQLAAAPDLHAALRAMAEEPRVEAEEACARYTFAAPIPAEAAIQAFCAVAGLPRFSIVLEIKSLRSTPALLTAMVGALNRRGIHVAAVCSFRREEVEGVSSVQQRVRGEVLGGPREVLFFHFAGDLQAACDAGEVRAGQSVLFNGASLLAWVPPEEGGPDYRVREDVVEGLAVYVARAQIEVGVYVQEGDCDARAAALLSALTTARPDVFALGFAWGGLWDEAHIPAEGVDRRGFGGQGMLALVGKARDWQPPTNTQPTNTPSG